MNNKPIRVLVVDDSAFVRETLTQALAQIPLIEVVGTAADPYEARDLLVQLNPEVMTLDMEMPKMNGTEFLRTLLPQWPIPVIMLSSHTSRGSVQAMDALSAGAVAVVFKPLYSSPIGFQDMMTELVEKIKSASQFRVKHPDLLEAGPHPGTRPQSAVQTSKHKIVAIGASTGGPQALSLMLRALPQELPPIIIAQHLPAGFSRFFTERLRQETPLVTREATDGEIVQTSHVYVAPSGMQTEIKKVGKDLKFRIFNNPEPLLFNPCIDILFLSIAKCVGKDAIGVLLTGMGRDGAQGLKAMYEAGAHTVGQDEKSSVVYGMPKVAKELGAVSRELSLPLIPGEIIRILKSG